MPKTVFLLTDTLEWISEKIKENHNVNNVSLAPGCTISLINSFNQIMY